MSLRLILLTLATTVVFEVLTCAGRFFLGLRSCEIAPRYKRYTLGVRIHHGYVGAAAVPPSLLVSSDPVFSPIFLAVAGGLILSDLVHHFLVLPLTTGEFD
jgi:hypothetical protein